MSTSSGLKQAILTWLNQRRKPTASNQLEGLYLQCSQLPFDKFLRCLLDGDLSALIIKGKHSQGDLAECWANIYYEFIDLSENTEALYVHFLERDITLLSEEIFHVETCLYFLSPQILPFSKDHTGGLISIIKGFGYKISIDINADYSPVLEGIKSKLAPKKIKLANKEKELKDYLESKKDDQPTWSTFNTILHRISKHQGHPVRAKEITTLEYIDYLKECLRIVDEQQNKEK